MIEYPRHDEINNVEEALGAAIPTPVRKLLKNI